MDDLYNISILDGVDDTISYGDERVDPFNILDVVYIKTDNDFATLFNKIDIDNLFNETSDFNEDKWEHLLNDKEFILMESEMKDYHLRFAWWVCRELLFNPEELHLLNITDLLKDSSLNFYIKPFIYRSADTAYKLAISIPTGAQMIIKFKDNSFLLQ